MSLILSLAVYSGFLRKETSAIISGCSRCFAELCKEARKECSDALSIIVDINTARHKKISNLTIRITNFVKWSSFRDEQFQVLWDAVCANFENMSASDRDELVAYRYLSNLDRLLRLPWTECFLRYKDPRLRSPSRDHVWRNGAWVLSVF